MNETLAPKNNNRSTRNQVQVKTSKGFKYELATFKPLEVLKTIHEHENWTAWLNKVCCEQDDFLPREQENFDNKTCTLFQLVKYQSSILILQKQNPTPDNDARISALTMRIFRFLMRWVTVQYGIQCTEQPAYALRAKLSVILKELQVCKINLQPNNEEHAGPRISLESTITHINKNLSRIEQQLKELLYPLSLAYSIPSTPLLLYEYPQIIAALKDISPAGFVGIEPDYHYVIQLILCGGHIMLKDEVIGSNGAVEKLNQQKQWTTYMQEFSDIIKFLSLPITPDYVLNLSDIIPVSERNLINKPFKTFITQTSCSKNTFAALVNTFNRIMPLVYLKVIKHFQAHLLNKKTNPNLGISANSIINLAPAPNLNVSPTSNLTTPPAPDATTPA